MKIKMGAIETAIWLLIISGVAGSFMLRRGEPFWWAGVGLLFASFRLVVYMLRHSERSLWQRLSGSLSQDDPHAPSVRGIVLDILALGGLLALVCYMMPDVAKGFRPLSYDHTVHLVKIQRLQEMLAQGRLWGWSNDWFAGYPANYLYPFGADLWVLLVHACTGGLATLSQSYAYAFCLHWVVLGWGLYACGKTHFTRLSGFFAAVLFISHTGAYREGGWIFTSKWGVWPLSFSMGLALLAIARLPLVLSAKRGRIRDVGWFGWWMGCAMLCHPIQLLHFLALLPMILFAHGTSSEDVEPRPVRWLHPMTRLALGYGIGCCLAALWWLPFLSTRAYARAYGASWTSIYQMAQNIYSLNVFGGVWSFVIAVGMLGLVGMLFSRRFSPLLFGFFAIALLITGSTDFSRLFHLPELSKSFEHIQWKRFILLIKPYMYLSFGYVVTTVVFRLERPWWKETDQMSFATLDDPAARVSGPLSSGRLTQHYVRNLVLATLLAPLALPLANTFVHKRLKPELETVKQDKLEGDKRAFVSWAKDAFPKDQGFYRLAILASRHDHTYLNIGPALGLPVYKNGFIPATIYKYKMESETEQTFRDLSVRYILTPHYMGGRAWLKKRKRFGRLNVYELVNWQPRLFQITKGRGKITVKRFEDEHITLEAAPGSQGTFRVHVSSFPRWHVIHKGRPLKHWSTQAGYDERTGYITMPLKPGRYQLVFRRGIPEWLGLGFFLLGLVLFLFSLMGDPNRLFWPLIGAPIKQAGEQLQSWEEAHQWVPGVFIAITLLAGGGMLYQLASWDPSSVFKHPMVKGKLASVVYPFRKHLKDAKASLKRGNKTTPCRTGFSRHHCGKSEWQTIGIKLVTFDKGKKRNSIWMHPQSGKTLRLDYRDVRVGDAIAGIFGIAKTGEQAIHRRVDFVLEVNGKIIYKGHTKRDASRHYFLARLPKGLRRRKVHVRMSVSAANVGRRHFCIDAYGINLRPTNQKPPTPTRKPNLRPRGR